MPVLAVPLIPDASELDALRSAMRDIQVSIRDYYRCSAGFVDADELATPVRSCVAFIQSINDVLQHDFSKQVDYSSMFLLPLDPRVGIIRAFTYVRNVGQHLLHPVRPDPNQVVGGIGLGCRTYATWQEIPSSIHDRLHASTQKLRPYYDNLLNGKEVTGTFLDAARLLWQVCPGIVHRMPNGEWTGFPLRHQAGVGSRLHPEEPDDEQGALAWMDSRKPGGDVRVLCGCLHESTGPIAYGLTFTGQCAFVPFFETQDQVIADVARGANYHEGDVFANTYVNDQIRDIFGLYQPTLCSRTPLESWIGPALQRAEVDVEWSAYETPDYWRPMWWIESAATTQGMLTRRERRLNATFPIR